VSFSVYLKKILAAKHTSFIYIFCYQKSNSNTKKSYESDGIYIEEKKMYASNYPRLFQKLELSPEKNYEKKAA